MQRKTRGRRLKIKTGRAVMKNRERKNHATHGDVCRRPFLFAKKTGWLRRFWPAGAVPLTRLFLLCRGFFGDDGFFRRSLGDRGLFHGNRLFCGSCLRGRGRFFYGNRFFGWHWRLFLGRRGLFCNSWLGGRSGCFFYRGLGGHGFLYGLFYVWHDCIFGWDLGWFDG